MKDDRGDNDLEVIIDKLTKQKELLQFQCRKAGDTISGYINFNRRTEERNLGIKKNIIKITKKIKTLLQGYKKVIE